MLRAQIKKWFEEAVTLDVEAPRELKDRLLLGHPNIEKFIDNLHKEMIEGERLCKQRGLTLKLKTMQDSVYDMTKFFIKGMEGEARRRYESDFDKAMRANEQAKIKEFDAVLAGKAEGEFAEAGVISNEKIDNERQVI